MVPVSLVVKVFVAVAIGAIAVELTNSPLLGWVGIALGFGIAFVFERERDRRARVAVTAGSGISRNFVPETDGVEVGTVKDGFASADDARNSPVDFVVLHPDGRITEHACDGVPLATAIRAQLLEGDEFLILDMIVAGSVLVWFDDDFAEGAGERNPLAGSYVASVAYESPHGYWRGRVAVSMNEGPGEATVPMPPGVIAEIERLAKG
ncbi:hypothetical protein [Nocardia lasii]|uniref:Uncharacterized protein n=1 Tax=Nocardia lasii TaxID=1616107 RepID=A0ABW1JLX9_9NOCA